MGGSESVLRGKVRALSAVQWEAPRKPKRNPVRRGDVVARFEPGASRGLGQTLALSSPRQPSVNGRTGARTPTQASRPEARAGRGWRGGRGGE